MRYGIPFLYTCGLAPLVVALPMASTPPGTPRVSPSPQVESRDTVVLKGCIRGGTLTNVEGDRVGRSHDRTYRLRGSKELLRQLKTGHAGHYVEVIGRLEEVGGDSRAAIRKRRTVGRVTITAEAGRGDPTRPGSQEIPSIEVAEFRHLSSSCRE